MVIEKNKVVTLQYHLTVDDKEIGKEVTIEQTDAQHPFVFLFGSGSLLESFENNIRGMKPGDQFDFVLKSSEAYGEMQNENIVDIPLEAFLGEDGKMDEEIIKVGNTVPMVDNEGHHMQGVVEEITDSFVKMDFNHPLAGMDLHFKGNVQDVRDASSEEISHGHVHGPGGHHH